MNIREQSVNIEFNRDELWRIACNLRNTLFHTIDTHWVHHQDKWENHEKDDLEILKTFFTIQDRIDMYDDIFSYAKKEFSKFNSK